MVDPPRQRSIGKADLVSASGQFSCPPTGNFVAVYGQDLMAADRRSATGETCGGPLVPRRFAASPR